jgi:hypothetical protein
MKKKMKYMTVNFEKFNKETSPFKIKYKGKEVVVVYYVDAVNYLTRLHQRIADASDLTDSENFIDNL